MDTCLELLGSRPYLLLSDTHKLSNDFVYSSNGSHYATKIIHNINPKKGGGVESAHRNFERSPLGLGQS